MNQIIYLIQRGIDVQVFSLYPGDFNKLHHQYLPYRLEERLTVVGAIPKKWEKRLYESYQFFKSQGLSGNIHYFLKTINPFKFGLGGLKLTHFLYLTRLLETQSCDLVHVHFGQMGSFFAAYFTKGLLNKTPYVVSFHGFDLVPSEQNTNMVKYRQMFQTAKTFTVNSNYTWRLLNQVNTLIQPKVRLLPESLDTRLFVKSMSSIQEYEDRGYKLVFVGRLVDWKGPDLAIRIINILVNELGIRNLELTIIGKGPLLSDLNQMVSEMGLSDHVKLLGALSHQEIKSKLGVADLFLYTGREQEETKRAENQGLVLMEAQAMGLPVVAFDVGGVGEGILANVTGILVQPGDLQEFAKQVASLLDDSAKRMAMCEAARSFVVAQFDIEILGKRLLEIYEEILS